MSKDTECDKRDDRGEGCPNPNLTGSSQILRLGEERHCEEGLRYESAEDNQRASFSGVLRSSTGAYRERSPREK